jgi:hypothetical protein
VPCAPLAKLQLWGKVDRDDVRKFWYGDFPRKIRGSSLQLGPADPPEEPTRALWVCGATAVILGVLPNAVVPPRRMMSSRPLQGFHEPRTKLGMPKCIKIRLRVVPQVTLNRAAAQCPIWVIGVV